MEFITSIDDRYIIPVDHLDNPDYIRDRCLAAKPDIAGKLSTVLNYLYSTKGGKEVYSLDNTNKNKVIESGELTEGEVTLLKYLFTRGNGSEKRHYGKPALKAARDAKYRCQDCGWPDVRSITLDHVWEDASAPAELKGIQLLCQNCHAKKSRTQDWKGTKLSRDKIAGIKKLVANFGNTTEV